MNSEIYKKMLRNHEGEEVLLWAEEDTETSRYDCETIGIVEDNGELVLAHVRTSGTAGAKCEYITPLIEGDEELHHPWVQLLLIEGRYRWYQAPHKNAGTLYEEWESKVKYREFY